MEKVIKEMYRLVKPGKYAIIIIGDTRRGGRLIPTSSYLISVSAKKYYTIWTKDNPDVYYHLDKLFSSPKEIRDARLLELENFEKQIAPL